MILAISLLLALPLAARADGHPDFKHDAKPLLARQPGLVTFVKQHFAVEETGYSRTPGNPPAPPYIFRAKPRGAGGPDTITLLIEDGPPGKILMVKNTGPFHPGTAPFNPGGEPAGAPEQTAPHIAAATNDTTPTPPGPSTTPVADGFVGVSSSTPSGPIKSSGSSNDPQQPLAPPADPAPAR